MVDSVTFFGQSADRSEGRYGSSAESVTLTLPTPGGANVFLQLTDSHLVGDGIQLQFSTTPGYRYRVDSSADFTTWLPVSSDTMATGNALEFTDPTPLARRFYRATLLNGQ